MQQVIKSLKEYSTQIDLKERFEYNFNIYDKIFSASETNRLKAYQNPFDQNIELKWILSEKYKTTAEQHVIDFWIINVWGGIRGFKANERNVDKISRFKKQINKRRLSLDCFSTISSLSKVASFLQPGNFTIYDSRVIFTLNWLILTCENEDGLAQKYFPIPTGWNKVIADFDMNTIINIFHLAEYLKGAELFISRQQAYFDFCEFAKTTSIKIFGQNAHPYQLEMLLFTLADKEIFSNLIKVLKLQFE